MYAWEGTNERPDHLRLNVAYWRGFDAMMAALLDRGLTAHLCLKVYYKQVNWPRPYFLGNELFLKYVVGAVRSLTRNSPTSAGQAV